MVQVHKLIDLFSQKKRESSRVSPPVIETALPARPETVERAPQVSEPAHSPTLSLLDPAKLARLQALIADIPTKAEPASAWNAECAALIEDLVTSRLSSAELAAILAGLISYRKTGVTPSHAHEFFISAFCRTSGVFQDVLHRGLFQHAGPPREDVITSAFLGRFDASARSGLLKELRQNGYCILPTRLDAAILAELNATAERLSYYARDRVSDTVPERLEGIDPSRPPQCGGAYASPSELLSSPLFKELMNDPLITELASEYLETPAQPINATLWYSFPAESASSELAQLFHYDLDTIRWLKVFYYLNDVTDENGPHEYVEGSHAPGAKSLELLERGYARISDEDIARLQQGAVRSVTGLAGTVILGDTRAFHKGTRVASGHRLIFQPIYAASKFSYVQDA